MTTGADTSPDEPAGTADRLHAPSPDRARDAALKAALLQRSASWKSANARPKSPSAVRPNRPKWTRPESRRKSVSRHVSVAGCPASRMPS